jgi:ABC-type lipoprotein release transport system permease subunit
MKQLVRLAWRSIWRNRRRTLLTVGSMAAALALAVYFLAIAEGMYGRLLYQVLRMQAGHLTVENAQHLDAPSIDLRLSGVPTLRARLQDLPDVAITKELIVGPGVANSGDGAVGVAIAGVEPSVEASLSPLIHRLVAGSYLEDGDERAVIVGAELSRRLDLEVGNKLVLSSNDVDGQLVQQMVRIKGIFKTGSLDLDGHYVQIPIGFARTLFSMRPDEATQIGLLLHDPDQLSTVQRQVAGMIASNQRVAVWPWQKIMPELSSFMKVDKGSNYVLQVIILLMAMFTIFNTILMSALERKREFAVMLALGTSPTRVKLQLLVESVILGVLGCGLGVLLGSGMALATDGISLESIMGGGFDVAGFLVDPLLLAKLTPRITVGLGGAMVVIVALMSLVPMGRISRINVTDAFR